MKFNKTFTLKDGGSCVVRNGTENDAEAVLANFILTHGQTEYLSTYPDETFFTVDQEKEYLKRKTGSCREILLVAEIEGMIVGTALVNEVGTAEKVKHRASFGISIDKAWWGLGIGRALTEACIDCAKTAGYTQMELGVVSENSRAVALYKSVGFAEYGRNPKAFHTRSNNWQEDVLMRLELDKPDKDKKTEQLILHFVTGDDLAEVARTWPSDHSPVSEAEARGVISHIRDNYARNTDGCVYHLCLAVCRAADPRTIIGWCGLDGGRNHTEPEIFILLDENCRNKGYGTQCVKELLRIAVDDFSLQSVHGGCVKDNIASRRAMEKGGMVQYGTEENGDPLFRFCVK